MITWTKRAYCLVAALGLLIIILAAVGTNSTVYSGSAAPSPEKLAEFDAFLQKDNIVHTVFSVPAAPAKGDNLAIFTADMELWVMKDGALAYAETPDYGTFGDAMGCRWHLIPIDPDEAGTSVDIYTRSTYSGLSQRSPVIKFGQIEDFFASTATRFSFSWLIGIALIILGCVFLVVSRTVVREAKRVLPELDNSVFYLGFFSILLGLWSGCQLQFISLFFENSLLASMLANVPRALMMPIFAFYIQELCSSQNSKALVMVCVFNTAVSAAQILLQLFGVACLEETVAATQVAIVLSSVTVSAVVYRDIRSKKATRVMRRHVIPVLICFVCATLDAVFHYFYLFDNDLFGRAGFIYLILFSGFTSLNNARKMLVQGKESELYKRLATSDALTGLPNRTSLVFFLSEAERKGRRRCGFFMMDLNNLKECNDSMGHHAGDAYLRAGASIISTAFESCGRTYRIGGDEFLVVVEHPKQELLDECICEMARLEQAHNHSSDYLVSIAWGYAEYCRSKDTCYDDTINRADAHMYQRKKDMKPHEAAAIEQKRSCNI